MPPPTRLPTQPQAPPPPPPGPTPGSRGARGPAWAALWLALLGASAAGTAALALQAPAAVHATRPAGSGAPAPGLLRDVLTGRLLDDRGVPLPPAEGWGSPGQPIRLRFVPSGDNTGSGAAVDDMLEFLRRRTGFALEAAIARSYGLVVQEIVEGQCELAFLTSASYARAWFATSKTPSPEDDVTAILSVVRQGSDEHPGSDLSYRGAFLVRADSPLSDVRQLTPRHVVAMGNRTSGASSMLPTAHLNALGVSPRVLRLEKYPILINAVLEGAADVGCIWWMPPNADNPVNDARILVKDVHPDVFERTRLLGFTAWIPNEPVVARRAVPAPVRHVLARALSLYVSLHSLTEAGRRELESIGSVVALIPADDGDFQALFETIERAFAHDPEGREDFMRGGR